MMSPYFFFIVCLLVTAMSTGRISARRSPIQCVRWAEDLMHPQLRLQGATIRGMGCFDASKLIAMRAAKPLHRWTIRPADLQENFAEIQRYTESLAGTKGPVYPTSFGIVSCLTQCQLLFPETRLAYVAIAANVANKTVANLFGNETDLGKCLCIRPSEVHSVDFLQYNVSCCQRVWNYSRYLDVAADTELPKYIQYGGVCTDSDLLVSPPPSSSLLGFAYELQLLCPLNSSLCNVDQCEEKDGCCVPKGSLEETYSVYTGVFQWVAGAFVLGLVLQGVWWLARCHLRRSVRRRRIAGLALWLAPLLFMQDDELIVRSDEESTEAAAESIKLLRVVPDEDIKDKDMCCPICLDTLESSVCVETPCEHLLHSDCLADYMAYRYKRGTNDVNCPMCRGVIITQSLVRMNGGSEENSDSSAPPERRSGRGEIALADHFLHSTGGVTVRFTRAAHVPRRHASEDALNNDHQEEAVEQRTGANSRNRTEENVRNSAMFVEMEEFLASLSLDHRAHNHRERTTGNQGGRRRQRSRSSEETQEEGVEMEERRRGGNVLFVPQELTVTGGAAPSHKGKEKDTPSSREDSPSTLDEDLETTERQRLVESELDVMLEQL